MGPLLALYQNQQEPQPRERDYFYVGAFYIFSLWVALGVVAIVDYIKQQVKNQKTVTYSSRITSYNVCYTKLLRLGQIEKVEEPFIKAQIIVPTEYVGVITSYSIHYTKLYESAVVDRSVTAHLLLQAWSPLPARAH